MKSQIEQPITLPEGVAENVAAALSEDVGSGDITASLVAGGANAHAEIITREDCIFCGNPWINEVCRQVDPKIEVILRKVDGDAVTADEVIFELKGSAASLLTAERCILNFVQLLSGTATQTRSYIDLIKHTRATILDTRKTIPGLRQAQKYAVRCAGAQNHRMGLFDAFLIKENHIAACGGIAAAVRRARENHPGLPVEVEVENLEQLGEALAAEVDVAMLDNFNLRTTAQAVALVAGNIKLEASGGVNKNTLVALAATGVDFISVGELTKNINPIDLSMRFTEKRFTEKSE